MKDRETMNEFEINLSNMLSDMEAAEGL